MRTIPADPVALQIQSSAVASVIDDGIPRRMLNVARYTEDLSWAYYGVSGSITKGESTRKAIVDNNLIALTPLTCSNFYSTVECRFGTASLTPFVSGGKYLLSYYAYADNDVNFYMRNLVNGSSQGHGLKGVRGGKVKRVWALFHATSTSSVDQCQNAETVPGVGTAGHPFVFQGCLPSAKIVHIGGVQIESVDPTTKNGIALIGDSTAAGGSGKLDLTKDFSDPNNFEWSTHLGVALNCDVYNRAVGGDKLTDMDARFNTDIVPLFSNSKYVCIQGGINDVANGSTLVQTQNALVTLIAKAEAAGWSLTDGTIKLFTLTPSVSISVTPAKEIVRLLYNTWLKSTYGNAVYDIASVVTSPWDAFNLNPAYYGDGVHFTGIAKEAIANKIVTQGGFVFTKPSIYQAQRS